ncbi:MAG TPA: dihydropteroate synthase [Acidimicrobiia bacterium]|nr:dihydropteroate synthase [Acidimicrobiia bacterium]
MAVPLLRVADLPRRALMGIVNVTPDSFSDGGQFLDPAAAIAHGQALADAGAAILDIGGESTRPGAEPVSAAEELARVLPVVRALAAGPVPVSIDTAKAEVAAAALDAGARMVNDVSGGVDPEMLPLVARTGAAYVTMHMRGTPRTMQQLTDYDDVVRDVARELRARVDNALAAGIARDGLLADPGIGFAKTLEHNVALLRALPEIASATGVPMVVGTSRKSFLARLAGDEGRDDATLATTVWSFEHGAAMVRVHDVAASARAVALLDVLERATPEGMAA